MSASLLISIYAFRCPSVASYCAASRIARSISASERLELAVIVISWCLPVPRSFAETCTIPFASISNVTSICGTPAGAALIPRSWKRPSSLLSLANCRSPCKTLISTEVWKLDAVEKTLLYRVGIVVLRSISFVETPPTVSMERESGVTSIRIISAACVPATSAPESFPPCTAAPSATHSSGFKFRDGSFPVSFLTWSNTAGTRVEPPTSRTSPRSAAVIPASLSACCTGPEVRSTRSCTSSLNFARVNVISMCFGSPFTVVINGRLILVQHCLNNNE